MFGHGLLLVILAIVIYLPFNQITKLKTEYFQLSEESLVVIESLERIKFSGLLIDASINEAGFTLSLSDTNNLEGNEALSLRIRNELKSLRRGKLKVLGELRKYIGTVEDNIEENPEDSMYLGSVKSAALNLVKMGEKVENKLQHFNGAFSADMSELLEELETADKRLQKQVDLAIEHNQNKIEEKQKVISKAIQNTIYSMIIGSIILLICIIGMTIYVTHLVVNRIISLRHKVVLMGNGEFDVIDKTAPRDEISDLINAFSKMASDLNTSTDERKKTEELLKIANSTLEKEASIDGLTHIANRRKFDMELEKEWKRAQRGKLPLSVILCDVDYFKQYNDTYGHQSGDDCLRSIAQKINDICSRPGDIVARYGGEELAIILPDTRKEGAMQIAESVKEAVVKLDIAHNKSQVAEVVTISLGVASMIPRSDKDIASLIKAADLALYTSKEAGRNSVNYMDDVCVSKKFA
jgi:diguanylate cyclase (GGDEF)-like protein